MNKTLSVFFRQQILLNEKEELLDLYKKTKILRKTLIKNNNIDGDCHKLLRIMLKDILYLLNIKFNYNYGIVVEDKEYLRYRQDDNYNNKNYSIKATVFVVLIISICFIVKYKNR